ncbi:hypothetical protein GEV33_009829 [Tenebrio molitor]|uniref:Uncharacterized protein n=1 Tax=Tenebrio molitor TaxID=7067 RepID=A0A8J6LBB4_TENMO|nr:hypothetical protein GEV33_009829 [Tenebrio molitor]
MRYVDLSCAVIIDYCSAVFFCGRRTTHASFSLFGREHSMIYAVILSISLQERRIGTDLPWRNVSGTLCGPGGRTRNDHRRRTRRIGYTILHEVVLIGFESCKWGLIQLGYLDLWDTLPRSL